eukprot:4131353-Pyramimonas_sp.AAC.1
MNLQDPWARVHDDEEGQPTKVELKLLGPPKKPHVRSLLEVRRGAGRGPMIGLGPLSHQRLLPHSLLTIFAFDAKSP